MRRGKKDSTRTALEKLLCVYYDNSPETGRYHENLDDNDITDIETRIEDHVEFSDLLSVEGFDRNADEFTVGDAIPTVVGDWR
jgi:hypothetical protein